jgi:hypothetical protein
MKKIILPMDTQTVLYFSFFFQFNIIIFYFYIKVDPTVVGHFTQIIHSESTHVGCGAAIFDSKIIFAFCNYAIAQSDFIRPYKNGTVCSMCSKSNCKNNLCNCNKICQNYGVLDPVKCKCNCLNYANGEECENLICSKTDVEYGCFRPYETRMCLYENAVNKCPHLCSICSYRKNI